MARHACPHWVLLIDGPKNTFEFILHHFSFNWQLDPRTQKMSPWILIGD